MQVWVGVDVAKEIHWATAVDKRGSVLIDRRVANDPESIESLMKGLNVFDAAITVG
jgi:transposase